MRRIWPYFYWVGAIACIVVGYLGVASKSAAHQKADWEFVAESFLVFALYPICVVVLRRLLTGKDHLCRPSQFVKPTNSPLQLFRVMLAAFTFICLGGFAALPWANHDGFMAFWANVAAMLGLFLAEQIIYKFYSKKIIP